MLMKITDQNPYYLKRTLRRRGKLTEKERKPNTEGYNQKLKLSSMTLFTLLTIPFAICQAKQSRSLA